jgi:hypothetical protein
MSHPWHAQRCLRFVGDSFGSSRWQGWLQRGAGGEDAVGSTSWRGATQHRHPWQRGRNPTTQVLQVRGVFDSSPGVGFLLLRAPVRRLRDGEGSVRATPWAGGEASAWRAPSFRAVRSSSSAPRRRSSSGLVAASWEGGAGAGLGDFYAAQQPRVRAPAADDQDGAAAWRGDVEGIQQGQRIGKGSGRCLGCARGRRSARQLERPVEPVPSMCTHAARALYGQWCKVEEHRRMTGGPCSSEKEGRGGGRWFGPDRWAG